MVKPQIPSMDNLQKWVCLLFYKFIFCTVLLKSSMAETETEITYNQSQTDWHISYLIL